MKSTAYPLEKKLARLRCRLQFLDITRAASWMAVALLGGIGVFGAIDYWIRFQDTGMRVICTLSLLALVGWVCHRFCGGRFFGRCARKRLSSLRLAKSVEKSFPQLGDGLSSAVEFLHQPQDDPLAGSSQLRQAVIDATTAQSGGLRFADSVDRRPALRAVLAATGVCLLAVAVVAINPLWAQVAVARLACPWGNAAWPQKTHLKLLRRVDRVAVGGTFEVELTDACGAKLPADAKIFYRFYDPDGNIRQQVESLHQLGDVLRAVRKDVSTAFAYRITGGDDRSMDWIEVELVEPPSVESLCVRLTPPDYTRWPAVTIDENHAGGFRVLAGSRLSIEAAVNKPIESVQMHLGQQRIIPGRVSENGMRFVVPAQTSAAGGLPIEHSGTFWFDITDRRGISGGDELRWDIRMIEDRQPSVSVERPQATVYATPRATLPVEVLVEDDLAIRRVDLIARLEGCDDEKNVPARLQRKIVLFEASQPPERSRQTGDGRGESRHVKYRLSLSDLTVNGQRLKPGCKVVFRIVAEDYKPLSGQSDIHRLVIVSPEELLGRIAVRRQNIIAQLASALAMQRQSHRQVSDLLNRLQEAGHLDPVNLDQLHNAELAQREVARMLANRDEGVGRQIGRLLEGLENNRLDSPDVRRRLGGMLGEIDRLRKNHLAVIAAQMTAAVKSAQAEGLAEANDSKSEIVVVDTAALDALRKVASGQVAVSQTLQRMLGRLSQWDDYRRFHRQLAQLTGNQEALLGRSVQLAGRTLAKLPAELGPQEAAALRSAAVDQSRLARQLDRITSAMSQMVGKLEDNDPDSAAKIGDAVQCILRRAVAARMRSADDNLRRNRIAQAISEQRQIIDDLQAAAAIDGRRKNPHHDDELAETTDNLEPRQQKPSRTQQDRLDVRGQQGLVQSQKSQPGKKPQPGPSPGDSGPGADTQPTAAGRGPETEQIRSLIKRLWGELPPRDRERLLQYPVEEFLPQYEAMIEAYYKRLCEGDDSS